MKNRSRITITSIIAFAIIGMMNSCGRHVNHESKVGEYLKEHPLTDVTFEDLLKPKDEINNLIGPKK